MQKSKQVICARSCQSFSHDALHSWINSVKGAGAGLQYYLVSDCFVSPHCFSFGFIQDAISARTKFQKLQFFKCPLTLKVSLLC